VDAPESLQLSRALRQARDELRELKSHPLLDALTAALDVPPGDARLWELAEAFVAEFDYSEPTSATAHLEHLLDNHSAAVARRGS
jgi:hypothetical protein